MRVGNMQQQHRLIPNPLRCAYTHPIWSLARASCQQPLLALEGLPHAPVKLPRRIPIFLRQSPRQFHDPASFRKVHVVEGFAPSEMPAHGWHQRGW
jgi:hypothetical protein